ncbi:invasion associated locus B family protein [Pelagibacterium montanilacus]|uniref:invasion associated locus B family protein n=1 Tax=Pelagibacterium montanilacus TaxID=2185280 RepID=UPI000F8CC771|nr:invasion associated locus B family protein [Pelagibacterium montanilacus]
MTFNRALLAATAVLGIAMTPGALVAQQAVGTVERQASAEVQSARAAEDNWLKVCDELDDGRQACIMRQVITTGGVFNGSFMLRDDPSQESRLLAVAAVPLGMLLPFGLTWQIDGGKPVRVPYMVCDPQSCAAQLVVNEAYIQSLKRGGQLTLTAKNRRNEDVTIDVTLQGFTSVYDNEDAMTVQELNAAQAPASAIDAAVEDYANTLRQRMGSEGGEAAEGEAPAAPAEAEAQPAE